MPSLRHRAIASRLLLFVILAPALAPAHVVYQRKTLREWAQQADVIVAAEILSPLRVWSAPDGSDHQEYFSIRVVESVAGEVAAETFDVFPHAEGEPRYEPGDRALLFLDRTAARAEFARLADRFPYFTAQGAGHEWKLDDDGEVVAIARAWREMGPIAGYAARRDLLLRQLQSKTRQLRAEAIADLAQLRDRLVGDTAVVADLVASIRSDQLQVGEMIALIRMLERAPGFSAAAEIRQLAADSEVGGAPADRLIVIRAAGALRAESITEWLREQLETGDGDTKVAALIGLAHPWHAAAVPEVAAAALSGEEPRVAAAAVRTLGAIADREAIAILERIAGGQQRPLSNLAGAELRRLRRKP
jgi:hypothetical protein